jgi:hypothetical protein
MICVAASITLPPPVKPRRAPKTNQKSRKYYTLHTTRNNAFTLRVDEQARTSIVGFTEWDNAMFVGKMLEAYFDDQMEWPPTYEVGGLILPSPQGPLDVLHHLYIQQWEFDELKLTCTQNFLDMISINDVVKKKAQGGYVFTGNAYSFDADPDFYRQRLKEIHELFSDVNDLFE